MQSFKTLLCVVILGTTCGICTAQTAITPTRFALTDTQWEQRAATAADSPAQAREVILEGIYAGKTTLLAQVYQKMYTKKTSDIRLGIFGYAAVVSEKYRSNDDTSFKPAFRAAALLLQHACAPEEEMSAEQATQTKLKRTQDANAWLAWGALRLRAGFDIKGAEKAYNKALKLDPSLAEAYWWLSELTVEPYEASYFKAHVAQAQVMLDRAEKLEPGLHPFAVRERAYFYLDAGPTRANVTQALPLLQEYLRLWPTCPRPDAIQNVITQLQQFLADKNRR